MNERLSVLELTVDHSIGTGQAGLFDHIFESIAAENRLHSAEQGTFRRWLLGCVRLRDPPWSRLYLGGPRVWCTQIAGTMLPVRVDARSRTRPVSTCQGRCAVARGVGRIGRDGDAGGPSAQPLGGIPSLVGGSGCGVQPSCGIGSVLSRGCLRRKGRRWLSRLPYCVDSECGCLVRAQW